jgi:hypothetical protein
MNAFVMIHKEFGIYLGSCMGMGFWSQLDPAGQTEAVTFPDQPTGISALRSWQELGGSSIQESDIRFIPVLANTDGYATKAACSAAGLPDWQS